MSPFLSSAQRIRTPQSVADNDLLHELLRAIPETTIFERQIDNPELFVFGEHDCKDGSMVLNTPLCRVLLYLHEGLHKARTEWTETTVRARSTRLLKLLTDDAIDVVHQALVQQIRASE